jgi:hypothetical protein
VPANVAAAIVNNFYIVNTVHDIAYRYVLFLLPSLLMSFFPSLTLSFFLAVVYFHFVLSSLHPRSRLFSLSFFLALASDF